MAGVVADAMKHLIIRSFVGFLACWICLLAPATAADYTLMVFGDSLSASYGIDEDAGWVNLLAIQIEDTQLPFVVVNGSVSGETTTGGLSRLPSLLDNYAPELVILELGGNDGLRGLPLAQMRQNLSAMVDLISKPEQMSCWRASRYLRTTVPVIPFRSSRSTPSWRRKKTWHWCPS